MLDESDTGGGGGGGGGDIGGDGGGGGDEGGGGGGTATGSALRLAAAPLRLPTPLPFTGDRLGAVGLAGVFFFLLVAFARLPTAKSESASESDESDEVDAGGGFRAAAAAFRPPVAARLGLRAFADTPEERDAADEDDEEDESAADEDEDEDTSSSSESEDRLDELLEMYLAPTSIVMKSASAMLHFLGLLPLHLCSRPGAPQDTHGRLSRRFSPCLALVHGACAGGRAALSSPPVKRFPASVAREGRVVAGWRGAPKSSSERWSLKVF